MAGGALNAAHQCMPLAAGAELDHPERVEVGERDHACLVLDRRVVDARAASNREARRLIRGGGARINDTPVENETRTVSLADLDSLGMAKLSAGRKRHALMRTV